MDLLTQLETATAPRCNNANDPERAGRIERARREAEWYAKHGTGRKAPPMPGKLKFRIFNHDRGEARGVPMYSALAPLHADSAAAAERAARSRWPHLGPPEFAPLKAIEWPPTLDTSKQWLAEHV